jgi:hypothetical protein
MEAMTSKTLFKLGALLALLSPGTEIAAQSDIALETRKPQLQELARSLQARDAEDRRRVRAVARQLGIAEKRRLPNGRLLELQRIAPGIGPVFYVTNNVDAADTVSTDEVWSGGSAGLDLDGSGFSLGEWDGGAVDATHTDLAGRVTQVDGVTDVSEHSTHVAGTLIGAGAHPFYPQARGMAYAASLDAHDWNSDTAEMALAAANGMLISNHSYGIAAGWLYIGDLAPDTWWWIGGEDPTDVEDANFGYYGTEAQLWDQIAQDAPYYLIVKAGGNDRWDTGPLPNEEYTVIDQDGNFLFTSTLPRNADCEPLGYDCLPGQSVAKNILTVGAVDDITDGYAPLAGPSQVLMTGFSGWGPSDDGRIKPDIVGNGMWLVSTWPDEPGYAAALGTSMATPNITGSLLLLQEHYEDVNGSGNFMRAATLKALAVHTADESGSAEGPDYAFGWGLLNTAKAAEVISEDGADHRIVEGSLANTAVDTVEINVSEPDAVVRATLVWADPPGTPATHAVDPPDLMLVNDLDLRLTRGPSNWLPWVLDPANPADPAGRGDNFRDNVEQVVAQVADTGAYFVEVSHKGTLLDSAAQDYSLIISILPAPPAGALPVIDENFSGGMPVGWSVDTASGVPWTIRTPEQGGDPYLANLTGGTGQFAMVYNSFTRTLTSLVMPELDLTAATGVTLDFDSNFLFSDWETVNVDVSTNGGSAWTNVWQKSGLIGLPAHYALDLTAHLAGQANAVVRFRYNTFGEPMGYYWQIDNVNLKAIGLGDPPPPSDPPAAASDPFPANGEVEVGVDAVPNWSAGSGSDSHDVYFGTDSTPDAGEFMGNQGGTGFDPGPLAHATTYYWRIDEVNEAGTTNGTVWSFTTRAGPPVPGPASDPVPADGATNVDAATSLGWTAGADTDSHDVYFGTDPTPDAGEFIGNQGATGFDPGPLADGTSYYWRIDEVNAEGTTTGDVWSFTTAAGPLTPFSIQSIGIEVVNVKGPRNSGIATITVVDEFGAALSGVEISGTFSGDWGGTRSGTTDGGGQLIVETPPVKNGATFDFCVDTASKTGYELDAGASGDRLCNPAPADTGSIAGVVTAAGGPAIDGATVSAGGQNTTTAADGSYSLNGLAVGPQTVTVSASGYQGANQDTTVVKDSTATVNFSLTAVTGGGGFVQVRSITVSTLNAGKGAKRGQAVVVVEDDQGNAVSGATVSGEFSGTFSESPPDQVSDGGGSVSFTTTASQKGGVAVTFCVTGISYAGLDDLAGSECASL